MKTEFLMGKSDDLIRTRSNTQETIISNKLRKKLYLAAIRTATEFYVSFFGAKNFKLSEEIIIEDYIQSLEEAIRFSLLIDRGGISEKDHLNLWCLGKVLNPATYTESGVFIGSSLHAFLSSSKIKRTIAIDPDISKLRLGDANLQNVSLISDKDFSEVSFSNLSSPSLVYFDDHIDAAKRIIQAQQKGFDYVLFDDATGLEGMCQRLYPAVPSVPMILNHSLFNSGESISWTHPSAETSKYFILIRNLFPSFYKQTRVELKLTDEIINRSATANRLIDKVDKLPDLGTFISQRSPRKTPDTTKYLIKLKKRES